MLTPSQAKRLKVEHSIVNRKNKLEKRKSSSSQSQPEITTKTNVQHKNKLNQTQYVDPSNANSEKAF